MEWIFSLDKNFAKPSYMYLCIAEMFGGINFANAVKVTTTYVYLLCNH